MTTPPLSPYDRLPNETSKAWAAFCIYRDMGGDRTQDKVRERIGHRSGRIMQLWSSKYRWVERCKVFDDDELQRQAIALREERLKRRKQMEKEAWDKSQKFKKKASTILDFPIAKAVTTPDGKTTYNPTDKWSLRDAIALDDHAHKLAIFATGGETSPITEIDAIRILANAGWLPAEILEAAERGTDVLKSLLEEAFKNLAKPERSSESEIDE